MTQDSPSQKQKTKAELREARLKAALKANMGRRKAQARARNDQTQGNKGCDSPTEESR